MTTTITSKPAPIPDCPGCHKPMVLRHGRNGDFYGCSQFPKCRCTVDIRAAKALISKVAAKPAQTQITDEWGDPIGDPIVGAAKSTTPATPSTSFGRRVKSAFSFNPETASDRRGPIRFSDSSSTHSIAFAAFNRDIADEIHGMLTNPNPRLFNGTEQQIAIWEELNKIFALGYRESPHIAVMAAPGTGKTSVLVQWFQLLRQRGCAVDIQATTYHSLGLSMCVRALGWPNSRNHIDKWKLTNIVDRICGFSRGSTRDYKIIANALRKIVGACKNSLVLGDPQDIDTIIDHYDIEVPNEYASNIYSWVPQILDTCRAETATIDYDDMLWLPAINSWSLGESGFNELLGDESQDSNPVQRKLTRLACPYGRITIVGDKCQPGDELITIATGKYLTGTHTAVTEQKKLKDLRIGDKVVCRNVREGNFVQSGSTVTGITKRPYKGRLIRVTTNSGLTSRYTPDHICMVRGRGVRSKFVVYLMESAGKYRIGSTFLGRASTGNSGLANRLRVERGRKLWVLSTHDTRREAFYNETITQHLYSIPGVVFRNNGCWDQGILDRFWKSIGDLTTNAVTCLNHFGRLLDYPMVVRGVGASWRSVTGFRLTEIRACNLLDGMEVLVYTGRAWTKSGNAHINRYESISLTEEQYCGNVYSLSVNKHKNYIAGNILTHNCQSIYGFRGVAVDALEQFVSDLNRDPRGIVTLPLTITQRCPQSHVELATRLFGRDKLQAVPEAPTGIIRESIPMDRAVKEMVPGDVVLCRVNKSLVGVAYALLKRNVKVLIRGKNFGESLSAWIKSICDQMPVGASLQDLLEAAETHYRVEFANLAALGDKGENRLAMLTDRHDCIVELCSGMKSIDQLVSRVENLFSDERPENAVVLSTIHRFKGNQANRIWILNPELLPHPKATGWQREQELNLLWVALTRAKWDRKDPSGKPGSLLFIGDLPSVLQVAAEDEDKDKDDDDNDNEDAENNDDNNEVEVEVATVNDDLGPEPEFPDCDLVEIPLMITDGSDANLDDDNPDGTDQN